MVTHDREAKEIQNDLSHFSIESIQFGVVSLARVFCFIVIENVRVNCLFVRLGLNPCTNKQQYHNKPTKKNQQQQQQKLASSDACYIPLDMDTGQNQNRTNPFISTGIDVNDVISCVVI